MELLMVDDIEQGLIEYSKFFIRRGIPVLRAATMVKALEIINDTQGSHFDIALLDMRMGANHEGGLDLLREIRKVRPAVKSIIITGYGTQGNEAMCNAEGLFAYVDRATDRLKVLACVQRAYEEKEGIEFRCPRKPDCTGMWAFGLAKGESRLSLLKAPFPRFRKRDIVARTLYLGICGTDVHRFASGYATPQGYNLIGFHEAVAEVVAKGGEVDNSIEIGDWIVPIVRRCQKWLRRQDSEWDFHTTECEWWQECENRGHADMCPRRPGYLSRGTGKYHGFASEYFSDSVDHVVKITKEQKATLGELCVLTEPLSIAWKLVREIERRRGIRKFRDRVLVLGIGSIGLFCVIVLSKLYPGLKICAADICTSDDHKVHIVDKYLHEHVTFHTIMDGVSLRNLKTPRFDIIIDATGDITSVITQMCEAIAPEGLLGLLSISDEHAAHCDIKLTARHFDDIVSNGVKIIGSVCASKEDMEDALRFMEDRTLGLKECLAEIIFPRPMLSPSAALEELQRLYHSKKYLKIAIDVSRNDSWPPVC